MLHTFLPEMVDCLVIIFILSRRQISVFIALEIKYDYYVFTAFESGRIFACAMHIGRIQYRE
jgi:hypothetical protein